MVVLAAACSQHRGVFEGESDSSLLVNRKSVEKERGRERVCEGERERDREREGECVCVRVCVCEREREGERGELLLPNYSDWAGSAPFTNRTRCWNPVSPNLTSKHRGAPDWENRENRERERERVREREREWERERERERNNNNCVSLFWESVHTAPPPLPSSLPTTNTTSTPLCRISWTIQSFFYIFLLLLWFLSFFLEERHLTGSRRESWCTTHTTPPPPPVPPML